MTTRPTARVRGLVAGAAAAALTVTGLAAALTTPATALSPIRHCSVQETTHTWPGGFVTELTVTMLVPVSGWTLEWTNTPGQRVLHTWNARSSGSDGVYRFQDAGWNGDVPVDGTFRFGFQGTSDGAWTRPSNITVNGVYCLQYMPPWVTPTPTVAPVPTLAPPASPTADPGATPADGQG
ncbi:cellulose binding domain-containing protein [Cellulomonas phragmiteti]|uniref:CBM2 domain-containing protein n=1 Tax=Cellulomonas phragmiteti TaxID=478780 RepID=A0ABQ4DN53_9CELL|nr:cellulose binding domain-containing protein [Cellulomonas phragmiteti]GIG40787.1 hypothetical protein Cph01nite_25490 [Cellulomonas phragmiteti]